jgi:hypothetical protein
MEYPHHEFNKISLTIPRKYSILSSLERFGDARSDLQQSCPVKKTEAMTKQ